MPTQTARSSHASKTMKAVRHHGPGDLRVDEVPVPTVGPGDVLLRVRSVGVCTTDRKIAARGHFRIPASSGPRVLGHEIVGEVVEVGEGARGVAPGTRVAVAPNMCSDGSDACVSGDGHLSEEYDAFGISLDGGMAEYMLVPARAVEGGHLLPLSADLPNDVAVLLEPLACCYNSLEICSLRPGESLMVVGGGAMGQLHASIATGFGAGLVVVSDPYDERLERARALGADATIRARDEDVDARVAELTGGRGFDVISVTAGSPAAQSAAVGHAATRGRINLFASIPADEGRPTIDANRIHYRQIQIVGTTGASILQMRRTLRLLGSGRIDPSRVVTARYPLERALEAFEAARSKAHARVILEP